MRTAQFRSGRALGRCGSQQQKLREHRVQRPCSTRSSARVVRCSVGTEKEVQQQQEAGQVKMPVTHTGPPQGASSRALKAFNQSGGQNSK